MAFVKVVQSDSFDFGMPALSLIDVHSRGMDKAWMMKRASSALVSVAKELRPNPDYAHLHLISMGAQESFGCNRNGDGFNEKAGQYVLDDPKPGQSKIYNMAGGLVEHHRTFTKHAHVFRHHKNDDPKYAVGDVYAEHYNPIMKRGELIIRVPLKENDWDKKIHKLASDKPIAFSMACFPPGELVKLSNWQEIPIEQVSIGETVITHMGHQRQVEAVMRRPYCGDLVVMRASGLAESVRATPNHKIWVRPTLKGKAQVCPVCSKAFRSLKSHFRQKLDAQHQLAYRDYGRYAENWCPSEQVATGDYVRTPFNRKVTAKGCPHLAVILGYYLSEGNVFNYGKAEGKDWNQGVDFSFNVAETHLVENLCNELAQLGYLRVKTYTRKNNVALVRVSSVKLYDEMLRLGGKYSWGKQIEAEVMGWEPSVQLKLVNAFLDGDGHFSRSHPDLTGTTVSRTLAFQLAEMCWRNDVPARVNSYQSKQKRKRRAYIVVIQGRFMHKFNTSKRPGAYQFKSSVRTTSQLKHQRHGSTAVYVAGAVLAYVEKGFVYRRVSKVFREFYDGPVFNLTVADDHSYVINGVAVSNCKVAYDVCTSCGNKSPSRVRYCDHLRDHMTEITKSGHQIFAINDVPQFFDISEVIRPADRIAYSLYKAANMSIVGGAELAEQMGAYLPSRLILPGSKRANAKEALAHKLADIEKQIELIATKCDNPQIKELISSTPCGNISSSEMEGLQGEAFDSVIAALADAKICLSLRDFLQLTLGSKYSAVADGIPAVEDMMPGIFSRLMKEGSIEECVSDSAYDPRPTAISRRIKENVGKLVEKFSSASGPTERRMMIAAIRGSSPSLPERRSLKQASAVSASAAQVAKEYAKYQLSFVQAAGADNLTNGSTVIRNYLNG